MRIVSFQFKTAIYQACLILLLLCIPRDGYSGQAAKGDINSSVPPKEIDISGKIRDSLDQSPLVSVTIEVVGAGRTTRSGIDGSYHIRASENATLVFRHVGYAEKYVYVGNRNNIDVLMVSSYLGLDEVAVVAFSTQKKETVTGAISSVKTREIKQSPAANLAVTLAGRLPGLTTLQTSGEPGRDFTYLFIRGRATVNQTSPVVLIDGIERDLSYIDPNEVESVTILKDASATALFGVRGANGVVLVTTKRGTSELPQINFSMEMGLQSFPKFIKTVDAYDYASLKNLALENDGLSPMYSDHMLEMYRTGEDPLRFPNTDWRKIMVKDVSLQNRYNLNISGTSNNKAMSYFVNATYLNQGGQFNVEKGLPYDPSFKLDRYSFRSNIDLKLNKSLKVFLNVAGYLEKQNMPMGMLARLGDVNQVLTGESPAGYLIINIADLPANTPGPLTPDGEVVTAANVDWPAYGLMNRSGYVKQTRSSVLASFGAEQQLDFITPGLSAKVIASFDTRAVNNMWGNREFAKYIQLINPNVPASDGKDSVYFNKYSAHENTPLSIGGGRTFSSLSNFQGYLNYARTFGRHNVSGMLLFQQQQNIANIDLPYNLRGVSGRFTYGYDDKYFFEFNAGYNGSEQFAKGKRYGFFPAFSAGWLMSKENFLKNSEVITSAKLRGSYGWVGNDRIGSRRFLYLDDITVVGGGYNLALGRTQSIAINMLKNADISWEIARKLNIGLELRLLNTIDLTVDVFRERRSNILRSRGTIPLINGFAASILPPVNIGVIENKGYEIELGYRKAFNKNLSFLTKLNFNYAINKQIYADEPMLNSSFAYKYRQTGYSLGQYFGYRVLGYFKDEEDVLNSPVQNVGGHPSRPGDFKYADLNKDNIVDERDIAPIGYSDVPEYTFGAAFSFTYRDFDISVLFQGVANVSRYFWGRGVFASNDSKNYTPRHLQSWTAERAANGETINYPRLTTQVSPNEIMNDFFLNDASFIRLKNAEIGYNLPIRWANKISANKIRVYANASNISTWDHLRMIDLDPEIPAGTSYPIPRIINFGVNVIF